MDKKIKTSVVKDWGVALLGLVAFFAVLKGAGWIDQNFDFSAIYNVVDGFSILMKVAIASALAWSVKKFVFPNTVGRDFGQTFDSGWEQMSSVEKTRWTIGLFVVIFLVIMFNFQ